MTSKTRKRPKQAQIKLSLADWETLHQAAASVGETFTGYICSAAMSRADVDLSMDGPVQHKPTEFKDGSRRSRS